MEKQFHNHACEVQIYISMEDPPPLAIPHASSNPHVHHTCQVASLFSCRHVSSSQHATPSLDPLFNPILTRSLGSKPIQPGQFRIHPRHLQPDPKLDSKPGHRVCISNLVHPNRPTRSSYPNWSNFINSVHWVRPDSYYFGSTMFNGPWVMAKSWPM
jgi:hypothetical protein